jgi:hypothetical protein
MPRYVLNEEELDQLVSAVISQGGSDKVAELLDRAPEFKTFGGLAAHEKYFCKELSYQNFDIHIPWFDADQTSVIGADIQLKRPAGFPWPFVNRNRRVVTKLLRILRNRYSEPGVTIKDSEAGGKQIHFRLPRPIWQSASTPFEEWGSECAIYDEPYSSGQTSPDETRIRNDFVIIRFRRQ